MDDIDRAQTINEQFQGDALARHLRTQRGQAPSLKGPVPLNSHCRDCEEPIPQARRSAIPGCQRCIDCQTLHENWRPL